MKHSFDDIKISKKRKRRAHKKDEEQTIPIHIATDTHEDAEEPEEKSLDARMSFLKPKPLIRDPLSVGEKPRNSHLVMWGIALFAVLFVVFSFFGLFAGATIKVTPKQEQTVIEGEFITYQEEGEEKLTFDVMILAKEEGKDVPATEEREVERKASGQIVIYNKHSGASQPLIKNTRFETPDGKTYRIKESVTVPGTTVENGEIVPGSLEVTVYADEPGESYNVGLTDFTVPGFKGSPQYQNFYARSKTEMTGGFSGVLKYPSEEDIKNARTELQETLEKELIAEANVQKPENFILYEDGIFLSYEGEDQIEETSGNTVRITERATLNGVIFDRNELAKFIARQVLGSYDGSPVTIPDMDQLSFRIVDKEYASPFDESLSFVLSGTGKIIWTIDEDALKKELGGKPKKGFQEVLAAFPHIERAEASIKPFWKRKFPEDPDKIKIENTLN